MADLEKLPKPWGRKTLIDTLQWREAAGRCKMVRTREWKYVHDSMGDRDELYDLVNDPHELLMLSTKKKIAMSWPICGCALPIGALAPRIRRRCPCPRPSTTICHKIQITGPLVDAVGG